MFETILDILQTIILCALIVYIKADLFKPSQRIKVDKYEDYRDPSTGRLRGKKVGSL